LLKDNLTYFDHFKAKVVLVSVVQC